MSASGARFRAIVKDCSSPSSIVRPTGSGSTNTKSVPVSALSGSESGQAVLIRPVATSDAVKPSLRNDIRSSPVPGRRTRSAENKVRSTWIDEIRVRRRLGLPTAAEHAPSRGSCEYRCGSFSRAQWAKCEKSIRQGSPRSYCEGDVILPTRACFWCQHLGIREGCRVPNLRRFFFSGGGDDGERPQRIRAPARGAPFWGSHT